MTPPAHRHRYVGAVLVSGALALASPLLRAAPPAAPAGYATHVVVPGETLPTIGALYLRNAGQWRELQRVNHVADAQRLMPGTVLQIPARLLRPSALDARVEFVRGDATGSVLRAPPAPLAAGAALPEGTRITVPDDSYLLLRLADGSTVRVLAGSDVELKRLRRRGPGSSAFESIIDLKSGKVESEVSKQPRGRVFEIHAPGAVASVRGTHFDVVVARDGRTGASVSEGVVAVQSRRKRSARRGGATLQPGEGVVVEIDGRVGIRRTLPTAPDLSPLPTELHDADALTLDLGMPQAGLRYEARIARDADLREIVRDGVFDGARLRFAALDDGDYTLGVRVLDADGLAGAESRRTIRVHARPVAPLYQSPAPDARISLENGQLVCSEVAGTSVHLQVSSRPDFSRPEIDRADLVTCRVDVSQLPPGSYWWRVATVPAAGMPGPGSGGSARGPFAGAQRFELVATPTVGAVDVSEDGENPTLNWATTGVGSFHGQVARDEAFRDIVRDVDLARPVWTVSGLARGVYFVRLKARDAAGLEGPYSPARRLRVGSVLRSGTGGMVESADGEPIARP